MYWLLYIYNIYIRIHIYTYIYIIYKFTHQTHHAVFVLVKASFVWLAFQETECGMHTHLTRLRAAKRQVSCGFTSGSPDGSCDFLVFIRHSWRYCYWSLLITWDILRGQGTYSQCGTWSIWTIFEAMNHAAVYIAKLVHELGDLRWCWVNSLI